MKNLFFLAVPFVALLAGCPNGNGPGPGGTEGEGEGEQPFSATIDMLFPTPIANVVVNGSVDPCLDQTAHSFEVPEEGTYAIKPAPSDQNRRCVTRTATINASGAHQEDWNGDGACGLFPNGTYLETNGTVVEVTTTDREGQMRLEGDFIITSGLRHIVTDNQFHGAGDVNGEQWESSGTISDDLCQITYHEERNGAVFADNLLILQTPECQD